jgi:hypothetical protein
MADTNSATQNSSGLAIINGSFGLGQTALAGYFGSQTAKSLAKAPAQNTGIIVGGLVAIALIVLIALKK